jgi:hypothetical protein
MTTAPKEKFFEFKFKMLKADLNLIFLRPF